jgi:cellulose synthase/poly-beta-1,6-N-acetylglucosamine synthase-like glycosyltransferase
MVRAIWNGGALVLMTLLAIPWGGSLAIRRALVEPSGWRRVLRRSLCEDTALTQPLRRSGWRFRFAPALMAVDHDDSIQLRPLLRWIARQLVMARLHHPSWPLVLLHGLGTSLLLVASLLAALGLALTGAMAAALQLLAALLLYELGCAALLLWIQALVAAAIPLPQRLPLCLWLRWLPLAQLVYGLAALRAQLASSVEWSGVVYRLRGRGVVQATGFRA